jgi:methylase of polypeptide subunit release factors
VRPVPLTERAQQAVGGILRPGDRAIDATVGNGHDTLFLASQVARDGRVIGFDIQPQALASAQQRLDQAGLQHVARLLLCGHQRMTARVPADWTGQVSAVMFNLGYLPGSDKTLTTQAGSTLSALDQALDLLRIGGLISLLVYRGHDGANEEAAAVQSWLGRLDQRYDVAGHASPGPTLYLIRRLA